MNYDKIPQELKNNALWCVWKRSEKGKIPYNPLTGGKAQSNNESTFSNFQTAYSAYSQGIYDGLGIGIFRGYAAVDIDHCIINGNISQMANDIINRMGTYTECSPSGEGVHIIFKVNSFEYNKEKYYINNASKGLECYVSGCTSKFVTITGNALNDSDITEGTNQLYYVLDAYMRRQEHIPRLQFAPSMLSSVKNDSEWLEIGFQKDPDLLNYWNGNFPVDNESEKDSKLISRLLYWLNGDKEKAISAFLSSPFALNKDNEHMKKLQRRDYLDLTANEMLRLLNGKTAENDNRAYIANQNLYEKDVKINNLPFEWGQPREFPDYNLPAFPCECLPSNIRKYVEAVAENLQVPVDMSATAALAVLALCMSKKYRIDCNNKGWTEPLNLYCVLIAPPSERKSPLLRKMTDIIYEYENQENKRNKERIEQNILEKSVLETKKNALIRCKPNSVSYTPPTQEQLDAISREIAEFREVKPLRLIADDISSEKLNGLLAENNGRMAIISAEGGIFDMMNGKYSSNGVVSIDTFLKGYSGDPIQVDRIGRKSENIINPALSVLLAIQPEVLNGLVGNSTFKGRGLPARFLYSFPKSKIGSRDSDPPKIPSHVKEEYERTVQLLLGLPISDEPQMIHLSSKALELSLSFAKELEPRLADELKDIGDFAGKLHGNIMRIAALLHITRNVFTDNISEPMQYETLANAITIGNYYLEHAQASYDLMGTSSEIEKAKYLLFRLRTIENNLKPTEKLTKRNIFKKCGGKFKRAADIVTPLEILCDYGYIRELPPPERPKDKNGNFKSGQPQSQEYEINPYFV